MNTLVMHSSTDLPWTYGRRAHHLYAKAARRIHHLFEKIIIVSPSHDLPAVDLPNVEVRTFTYMDQFNRAMENGMGQSLILWTSKPGDRSIGERMRLLGINVAYAELGITSQENSIILDKQGTGTTSSLCGPIGPLYRGGMPVGKYEAKPEHPVGICLQVEADWQFKNNGTFENSATLIKFLLSMWPDEKFLVRVHPRQRDVFIPEDKRVQVQYDGPLTKFFESVKCVLGVNSTSLLNALSFGHQVYQFGFGIGAESGAFIKDPTPPARMIEKTPEYFDRRRAASWLMEAIRRHELRFNESGTMDNIVIEDLANGRTEVAGTEVDGGLRGEDVPQVQDEVPAEC